MRDGILPDNLMKKKMKLSKWKSLMVFTLMVGGCAVSVSQVRADDLVIFRDSLDLMHQLNMRFEKPYLRPLHGAVYHGKLSSVKRLLEFCKDGAKDKDEDGCTPLHYCVIDERIAELLISYGADVYARNKDGYIPLQTIMESPVKSGNIEKIIRFLLLQDRHNKMLQAVDLDGNTPLHNAVRFEKDAPIARLFVHAGADVNAKNEEGDTPLHLVAENLYDESLHEIIRILLEEGHADTTVRNNEGLTPAGVAIKRGNTKAAELIFNHKQKH